MTANELCERLKSIIPQAEEAADVYVKHYAEQGLSHPYVDYERQLLGYMKRGITELIQDIETNSSFYDRITADSVEIRTDVLASEEGEDDKKRENFTIKLEKRSLARLKEMVHRENRDTFGGKHSYSTFTQMLVDKE